MAPKLNIGVLIWLFSSFFISIPSNIYARKLIKPAELMLPNINSQLGNYGNSDVLRFYVHDVPEGPAGENESVYEVARASITSGSRSSFGQVRVVDNLLTETPDRESRKIGRVQGLVTSADLEKTALAMNLNFAFTSEDLRPKTTLSVTGRCEIDQEECDVAVVGGTGTYRMARGFAFSTTYSAGVVEYVVYVTYSPYTSISEMRLKAGISN